MSTLFTRRLPRMTMISGLASLVFVVLFASLILRATNGTTPVHAAPVPVPAPTVLPRVDGWLFASVARHQAIYVTLPAYTGASCAVLYKQVVSITWNEADAGVLETHTTHGKYTNSVTIVAHDVQHGVEQLIKIHLPYSCSSDAVQLGAMVETAYQWSALSVAVHLPFHFAAVNAAAWNYAACHTANYAPLCAKG